ncbi:MAG: methyltransferase domain-containing protein [Planctomycetes bacterium]|nr:methyltransferase domain-containing protein [Planctomycetota bacterium]
MPTGAPPNPPEDGSDQEVSKSTYWNTIYEEQASPGWDLGHAAPALQHWIRSSGATIGRVCIPGCGYGYDVRALAAAGFEAIGVDFAPLAIERAARLSEGAAGAFEFRQGDIFELPRTDAAAFDYFYEYTCFVAIEPARRPEYVQLALELLKPGGLLIGCFYNHGREGGPPFDVTREQVLALYEPHFEIRKLEITPHSIERRAGHELWAEFVRA